MVNWSGPKLKLKKRSERIGARTVVKKFIYVREPIIVPILRIMPKADVMLMKPLFISWVSSRLAGGWISKAGRAILRFIYRQSSSAQTYWPRLMISGQPLSFSAVRLAWRGWLNAIKDTSGWELPIAGFWGQPMRIGCSREKQLSFYNGIISSWSYHFGI